MGPIIQAAFFILQLAVILLCAKIAGEVTVRVFKQPAVLGELLVGVLIGPFALGGMIFIPGHGALFPLPAVLTSIPVSQDLFVFAQVAAVILLFVAGLETNFSLFLKYALSASFVALGGVVLPFFLGAFAFVFFGMAQCWTEPSALFMGAIMTATSVGITARILSDLKKIETPEGVTILAGAVVDDIFGIVLLSVILSIAKLGGKSAASLDLAEIGFVIAKALGFWSAIMIVGLAILRPLDILFDKFRTQGAQTVLSLFLAFTAAALAEFSGLAMIIGAYAMGLILSKSKHSASLIKSIEPIYHFLVPVFFVVTGMFVDMAAFQGVMAIGLVISFLAIVGKFVGCGVPAIMFGFNLKGAIRVGTGMIPRGEVALIVALVGIAGNIIDKRGYGIAILMTLITTMIAPIFLGPLFNWKGAGRREKISKELIREVHKIDKIME